jgi:hypothetical protein
MRTASHTASAGVPDGASRIRIVTGRPLLIGGTAGMVAATRLSVAGGKGSFACTTARGETAAVPVKDAP